MTDDDDTLDSRAVSEAIDMPPATLRWYDKQVFPAAQTGIRGGVARMFSVGEAAAIYVARKAVERGLPTVVACDVARLAAQHFVRLTADEAARAWIIVSPDGGSYEMALGDEQMTEQLLDAYLRGERDSVVLLAIHTLLHEAMAGIAEQMAVAAADKQGRH